MVVVVVVVMVVVDLRFLGPVEGTAARTEDVAFEVRLDGAIFGRDSRGAFDAAVVVEGLARLRGFCCARFVVVVVVDASSGTSRASSVRLRFDGCPA